MSGSAASQLYHSALSITRSPLPAVSMMTHVMAVMRHMPRVLHAVTDDAAEDCTRRAGDDRAGGGADRRTARTAAVFGPVVTKRARGRYEQRSAEYGCSNRLISHL